MSSTDQAMQRTESTSDFGWRDPASRGLWVACIAIALVYILPTSFHYYPDSVAYTGWSLHNPWWNMLHPHHLILRPALYDNWWIAQKLGADINPLVIWRWAGLLCGFGSLWYMLRALRMSGFSSGWTALSMLTLASCWYMWIFTTTPTHYSLTLIWMMLIYHDLLTWKSAADIGDPQGRIAMALFVGVMIHQLAIFVLVPIVGWMWWLSRRDGAAFAPLPVLRPLLVPTIFIYLASAMFSTDSVDPVRIWNWLTYYGHNHGYWWWQNVPPGSSALGHWLSLIHGSFSDMLWVYPGSAYARLTSDFPAVMTAIEASGQGAPVANFWWTAVNPHMIGLTQILLTIIALWLPIAIWLLRRMGGQVRDHLVLALMWSAPFAVFHAGYCVGDGWFRLYYLLPLFWMLAAPIVLCKMSPWKLMGVVAWTGLLAFTLINNVANGYTVWRYPQSNPWLADLPLVAELEGSIVLNNDGELVAMDLFYLLAFDDRMPLNGDLVDRAEVPPTAVLATTPDWDRLYIEADLFADLPSEDYHHTVLHLSSTGLGLADDTEYWIPMDSLHIDPTPQAGIYTLLEAQVMP